MPESNRIERKRNWLSTIKTIIMCWNNVGILLNICSISAILTLHNVENQILFYRFLLSRNENHNKHEWNWEKKNASNKHQQPRPYRISSTIKIYHIEQNYRCDRLYCIAYARRKAVVEFRFNHLEYLYRFIDFFPWHFIGKLMVYSSPCTAPL